MIRNRTGLWQWILAGIVSITLWILSMQENYFEINFSLPLSPPSISSDFIVLNMNNTDSVDVTFMGEGGGVLRDQLMRHPESIQLDITFSNQNRNFPIHISRELTGTDIKFREERYSSLEATAFNPRSIELTIDRNIARELPVAAISSEDIPERYYWQFTSYPSVKVTGAESVVSQMDSCYTMPVTPDMESEQTAIVKPDGVVYIIPDYVTADLIPPVQVITKLDQYTTY